MFIIYIISLISTTILAYNLGIADEKTVLYKRIRMDIEANMKILSKYQRKTIEELETLNDKEKEEITKAIFFHDFYKKIINFVGNEQECEVIKKDNN